jgi:hypothetical protein
MAMFNKVVNFFDHLEDWFRKELSRYPIFYAFVGGIGVVMFWRGVWHTADQYSFLTGPVSLIIGSLILLLTGIFVSAFIGNRILLTGLRGEKKLTEKSKEEIDLEEQELKNIQKVVERIEKEVDEIKRDLP